MLCVMMGGNAVMGPEPWLERTGDNFEDWIDAIVKGKKSKNDFSWAAKVTEIMLLTKILRS